MLGREHAIGHPALTDGETGLANRLHFELVYSYMYQAADRGVPLTVLVVSTSEPSPEELRELGTQLQRTARSADLAAHLGHGRFALILIGTNLSGGRIAADRFYAALNQVASRPVSLALASYGPHMKDSGDLLQAVDNALRKAEEAGGGLEIAR